MYWIEKCFLNTLQIFANRNMDKSTDFKAKKYDEGKVLTEYVGSKGWAGNNFKSEILCAHCTG